MLKRITKNIRPLQFKNLDNIGQRLKKHVN